MTFFDWCMGVAYLMLALVGVAVVYVVLRFIERWAG